MRNYYIKNFLTRFGWNKQVTRQVENYKGGWISWIAVEETIMQFINRSLTELVISKISSKESDVTTKEMSATELKNKGKGNFPKINSIDKLELSKGPVDAVLNFYGVKAADKNMSKLLMTWYTRDENTSANAYLSDQYKYLEKYRDNNKYDLYWKKYFDLVQKSNVFFLANLSNWNPGWYKEYDLQTILDLRSRVVLFSHNKGLSEEVLRNVWIESPKGKFRCLSVPDSAMRLYTHMLNNGLVYLLRPEIEEENHGFLRGKGTLTAWKEILEGNLMNYEHIVQLDVSSGFPNLHKGYVEKYLLQSKKLPSSLINHIMDLLNMKVVAGECPTIETQIEQDFNKSWEKGPRGLPMGLGISPFLYSYTLTKILENNKLTRIFKWVNYADDLNIFITKKSWDRFKEEIYDDLNLEIGNLFFYLNKLEEFQWAGLQFNLPKYTLAKANGIWKNCLILLGLRTDGIDLWACTRGRGENPVTGKKSTEPQTMQLNIPSKIGKILNMEWLKENLGYMGTFTSYLYNGGKLNYESKWMKPCTKVSIEAYIKWRVASERIPKKLITKVNLQKVSQNLMLNMLVNFKVEVREADPRWYLKEESMKYSWEMKEKERYFKKYSEIPEEYKNKHTGIKK